ncbi:MAG: hypothetical protein GY938_15125, partial [Ketobacter sp.]|nr:hypothetical protein [Ketobacter sp.]
MDEDNTDLLFDDGGYLLENNNAKSESDFDIELKDILVFDNDEFGTKGQTPPQPIVGTDDPITPLTNQTALHIVDEDQKGGMFLEEELDQITDGIFLHLTELEKLSEFSNSFSPHTPRSTNAIAHIHASLHSPRLITSPNKIETDPELKEEQITTEELYETKGNAVDDTQKHSVTSVASQIESVAPHTPNRSDSMP